MTVPTLSTIPAAMLNMAWGFPVASRACVPPPVTDPTDRRPVDVHPPTPLG